MMRFWLGVIVGAVGLVASGFVGGLGWVLWKIHRDGIDIREW